MDSNSNFDGIQTRSSTSRKSDSSYLDRKIESAYNVSIGETLPKRKQLAQKFHVHSDNDDLGDKNFQSETNRSGVEVKSLAHDENMTTESFHHMDLKMKDSAGMDSTTRESNKINLSYNCALEINERVRKAEGNRSSYRNDDSSLLKVTFVVQI